MASHASGIRVSDELMEAFTAARQGNGIRYIVAQIVDEKDVVPLDNVAEDGGDALDQLDSMAASLPDNEARYIFFHTGEAWLFLCYVPDKAKVRQKMLYASTRATLKLDLGSPFTTEIFGTVPADFTRKGYEAFLEMQASDAPLTESEEQKQMEQAVSSAEASCLARMSGASGQAILHGVAFQPQQDASDAIVEVVSGGAHNYVQLSIDEANEVITLAKLETTTADEMGQFVPNSRPAFHIFRWDHTFEDQELHSIVYIFSCPDGSGNTKSAPVKSRMLFSSCKGCVAQLIEEAGAEIATKLEINEGVDLSETELMNKIHPGKVETVKKFSKPKPAGGRRLIRK